MSRNQVFAALFNLTAGLGSGAPFLTRSRKFRHFDQVPPSDQPAFFQTEHSETQTQRTGMDALRRWHASWVVYLASDATDLSVAPTITANDIIDSLEAALAVGVGPAGGSQTLGGLVAHAFIDGQIIKIPGDEDGQGMIVVPITLLIP